MKNVNYIILDCETGGFKCEENPITQIALLAIEPIKFNELRRYETYVKPYNDLVITDDALNATMVSMRDIQSGIDHRILVKKLIEFAKSCNPTGKERGRPFIIGHNIKFDIGFLEYLFVLNKKDFFDYFSRTSIDTLALAKQTWDADIKSSDAGNNYKLGTCCSKAGILLNDAHGAMNDTIATKELFIYFSKRLRNSGVSTKGEGEVQSEVKQRKFFEM